MCHVLTHVLIFTATNCVNGPPSNQCRQQSSWPESSSQKRRVESEPTEQVLMQSFMIQHESPFLL